MQFPPDIINAKNAVLVFKAEQLNSINVYKKNEDGSWTEAGRTGESFYLNERTLPTWRTAVPVYLSHTSALCRYRVQLYASNATSINVELIPLAEYMRLSSILTFFTGSSTGLLFILSIIILTGGIFFRDSFYSYFGGVTLCLLGHILCIQGTGPAYIWNFLAHTGSSPRLIYVFTLGAFFCFGEAYSVLRKNENCSPERKKTLKRKISLTNGILFIFPAAAAGQFFISSGRTVCIIVSAFSFALLCMFTVLCIIRSMRSDSNNRIIFKCWTAGLLIIIIRQVFHLLRLRLDYPTLRIFDHDYDIPMITSYLLMTIPVVRGQIISLRAKYAQLEINIASAEDRTHIADKRSYVYSRLSTALENPMMISAAAINSPESGTREQARTTIQQNFAKIKTILDTLSSLSKYESGLISADDSGEPVFLRQFFMNSVSSTLEKIKNKGNLPEIRKSVSDTTCVIADKALLKFFFQYTLDIAAQHADSETPVLVYMDYNNMVVSYSIHIVSKPITEEDSREILDLGYMDEPDNIEERERFNKLLSAWGVNLHIVKRIVNVYSGTIMIIPDSTGNTFAARIPLEQTPLEKLKKYIPDNTEESELQRIAASPEKKQPAFQETILIADDDDSMRSFLADSFRNMYNVAECGSTARLIELTRNFIPDIVIISDSLISPEGESALHICRNDEQLSSLTYFILASNTDKDSRIDMYRNGAVAIFEKPFFAAELAALVDSFLCSRRKEKALILNDISNVVRQSMQISPSAEHTERIVSPMPWIAAEEISGTATGQKEPVSALEARFTSAGLSGRETQIAQYIAEGKSDKEIAQLLSISPATVAVHNKKIFKKLDIHSRMELLK